MTTTNEERDRSRGDPMARDGGLLHREAIQNASAATGHPDPAPEGDGPVKGLPDAIARVFDGSARAAVILGDGFDVARSMADGAVDLVLADLPYDEKTHAGAVTNGPIDFDTLPPVETFAPALLGAALRWVLCFCAITQLGEYKSVVGDAWIRDGLWVRTNGRPQKSGDRPSQPAEGIAIMHRRPAKMRWNGHGKPAIWTGPICTDPTRRHPTKKPLWLMEALLRDFATPGGIVFDPTCGEGTTGEACMRLGLPFIGCEIDPKYHAMAVERVGRAERAGVQMVLPTRGPRAKQEAMFR